MNPILCQGLARHVVFFVLTLCFSAEAPAFQRIVEGFEGVAPTWTVQGSSSGFQIRDHSRTNQQQKSGKQSEFVHFRSSIACNAKLIHPIPQAQVIHDFCPQIAMKSTRDRICLSVRVILPRTKNPLGDGPLMLLIKLGESKEANVWETVGANEGDIISSMQRELRSIQHQYTDLKISEIDAYCDLLILDGFEKIAGEARIWIDDLTMKGFLPAEIGMKGEHQNRLDLQFKQKIEIRGSTLTVDDKPVFLRTLKHNGESMAFIKRLGFNSVLMKQLPTESQLAAARQYHVWILCPAPFSNPQILNSKNANMIFAWNIGEDFTRSEIGTVKEVVQQLRQSDVSLKRPTFCSAHFPTKTYANIVSLLRLKHLTFGTSFSVDRFEAFLDSKSIPGRPLITDIQIALPDEVMQQAALTGTESLAPWLSFEQIQQLVFRAIKAGSRGLVFDSSKNLEQNHRSFTNRLTRINAELMQIDPWLAGGTMKRSHVSPRNRSFNHVTLDPNFAWSQNSVVLELERSQLIWLSHQEKFRGRKPTTFYISTNQKSPRVCHVNSNGISPARQEQLNGQIVVELTSDEKMEVLVVSEDSLSFKYVQDSIKAFPHTGILNLRLQILKGEHAGLMSLLEKLALEGIRNPLVYSALQDSKKLLILGDRFVRDKQPSSALESIIELERQIAEIRKAIASGLGLVPEQKMLTSALNSDFKLIDASVATERFKRQATWSGNFLKESSFSNVRELAKSGWKQNLNETAGIQARVRLIETKFQNDVVRPVMQIEAWQPSEGNDEIDVTPIWLTSPKFAIRKKQLVRIEGWIKIDKSIRNSKDGFMIIDSIGGPTLAHREFKTTNSKTKAWKKFSIERIAEKDEDLQVVFALTGSGVVELTGLSIAATRELFTSN